MIVDTGISINVMVEDVATPFLSMFPLVQAWVLKNTLPFLQKTIVICIVVGKDVLASSNKILIMNILPIIKFLHNTLLLQTTPSSKCPTHT